MSDAESTPVSKHCKRCDTTRPASEFYKDKNTKDGLYCNCKACHREITDAWKASHKDAVNEIARRYRARNPDLVKVSQSRSHKKAYAANPEKHKARSRKNYAENKEAASEYHAKYRADNADKKREYARKYYAANAEKLKLKSSVRGQLVKVASRSINAERAMRRVASKRKASPAWANLEAIRAIYAKADEATETTGIKHNVDHIVPLQSRFVCGLHVEGNLQVMTRAENQSKGNRFWPDCPDVFDYPKPQRRIPSKMAQTRRERLIQTAPKELRGGLVD